MKLRLGPLPAEKPVRVTIRVSADLKAALDRYAVVHSELHGEPASAEVLIPHMLRAFIERDRGFRQARRTEK